MLSKASDKKSSPLYTGIKTLTNGREGKTTPIVILFKQTVYIKIFVRALMPNVLCTISMHILVDYPKFSLGSHTVFTHRMLIKLFP